MSLHHTPEKVKQDPPQDDVNYTRCSGCFNWFPFAEMVIDYSDEIDPQPFALCRRCDGHTEYERYWRVLKNAALYNDIEIAGWQE